VQHDNVDVQIWMMGYWMYITNQQFLDHITTAYVPLSTSRINNSVSIPTWCYRSSGILTDQRACSYNQLKSLAKSAILEERLGLRLLSFTEQVMVAPPVTVDGKSDDEFRSSLYLVVRNLLGESETLTHYASKRVWRIACSTVCDGCFPLVSLSLCLQWQPFRPLAEKTSAPSSPTGDSDRSYVVVEYRAAESSGDSNTCKLYGINSKLPLLQYSSTEIAQQMTFLEARLWRKIALSEFLDMRWQKQKDAAPTLVAICERFNAVAYWVSHSILEADSIKEQQTRYKKFLHISKVCLARLAARSTTRSTMHPLQTQHC
jgi:hypothetical protein